MRWLFLSGLICLVYLLPAQENILPTEGHYLTIGVGVPIHTVRDKAYSPLAYRGTGFRAFLSYEHLQPKVISQLRIEFDNASTKAYVKPKQDVARSGALTNLRLQLAYYFRLGDADVETQSYAGFAYEVEVGAWNFPLPANNTVGFLMQSNLSATYLNRQTLDWDNWALNASASLPLINTVYRPSYIGLSGKIATEKFKISEVFSDLQWGTFNTLTKLNINVSLDQQKETWRTNRFEYDWKLRYTSLPKGRSLLSTTGALSYGYRVLM